MSCAGEEVCQFKFEAGGRPGDIKKEDKNKHMAKTTRRGKQEELAIRKQLEQEGYQAWIKYINDQADILGTTIRGALIKLSKKEEEFAASVCTAPRSCSRARSRCASLGDGVTTTRARSSTKPVPGTRAGRGSGGGQHC